MVDVMAYKNFSKFTITKLNQVKKLIVLVIGFVSISYLANAQTEQKLSRKERINQRREKINQLIKQEEEGALIYHKQSLFGFNLNTDGWKVNYEHGKYKTITKTNIWWLELGERKDRKEEKLSSSSNIYPGLSFGNPFVFGKQNNFYYFKFGLGNQILIGGKGNKNGVAVSFIYGGGLSLGMLKPYYIQIQDPNSGQYQDIKYANNDSIFLNPALIVGASPFGKGFGEMKFVPGAHIKTALRFDYGRYNETISAIEVGINFEYYSDKMPMMVMGNPQRAFFDAHIGIEFGKRK